MRIFIGMETSGHARRAFQALGHHVISCDTLLSEDGADVALMVAVGRGGHLRGDVFAILDRLRECGWWPDMALFHPTCTYHTVSAAWAFNDPDFDRYPGVGYHQKIKPETLVGQARRDARDEAEADIRRIWALPIKRKAIENPIGTLSRRWRKPSQIVQPYQFGEDASKGTCLWLDELPELVGTKYVQPRMICQQCDGCSHYLSAGHGCHHCGAEASQLLPRWANQTDSGQNRLSPGENRWKDRSRSYPGIVNAMAAQWLMGGAA